jgi:hypothetical protein
MSSPDHREGGPPGAEYWLPAVANDLHTGSTGVVDDFTPRGREIKAVVWFSQTGSLGVPVLTTRSYA